jgi:hypothetical protein
MFNPIQFYEFGKSRGGIPNTFIGGVSATIGTKSLLATKLNILESDIGYFAVNGNNIEAEIKINYSIPFNCFNANNNITSFVDAGNKVTQINTNAFISCTSLVGDMVFDSLLSLGQGVFANTKITGFSAPNLTSIGTYAFQGTATLLSINISNVTTIEANCFENCTSLTGFLTLNSLTTMSGGNHFKNTKITSFSAPNLTTLGSAAFQDNTFLQSVNIPNIVTLNDLCFRGCTSLTSSLTLNSLTTMNGGSHFLFTKITSFSAPNLTNIGIASFNAMTLLTTFSAPKVTTIGSWAFENCSAITSFNLSKVTTLGASNTANNSVFNNIKTGCSITVPIAMQTINAGGVEPDLLYAQNTRGATIIYV